MIDNSYITLEDDIKYKVIDKIKEKDFYYIFLENVSDSNDICVRKEIIENDEHFLVGLNSSEELEKALNIFSDKNK